jgi:hypothetical protein
MTASHASPLRRGALRAYQVSLVLALAYVAYVVALKLARLTTAGPLGDVGEFLLVLACVTAFCVGLFTDEAARADPHRQLPPPSEEEPVR